jgi:hypothetical protein
LSAHSTQTFSDKKWVLLDWRLHLIRFYRPGSHFWSSSQEVCYFWSDSFRSFRTDLKAHESKCWESQNGEI